jgi:hypothetical protein
MREAARALDDVSDHLGEVLRRADELLGEWSQFGAQVRTQVEREVASVGDVVDGAVARAAGAGIDRAVADRLRALTAELERLEQRTRAASRAVVEQRESDRRVLWLVVAGIVLANALLVVLVLRKPEPAPVAEPVRIESTASPPATAEPVQDNAASGGSADPTSEANAGSRSAANAANAPNATDAAARAAGPHAPAKAATSPTANPANAATTPSTGTSATKTGASTPSAAAGTQNASTAAPASAASTAGAAPNGASSTVPQKAGASPASGGRGPAQPAGGARPTMSPIALPPKSNTRPHKKQP